jgi:hypothetical protein
MNNVRYDTIRYDTIRYDTIRYDTINNNREKEKQSFRFT